MKTNLFKNFKTLKEKESEQLQKLDNVSVDGLEAIDNEVVEKKEIEKKRPIKKEIIELREKLASENQSYAKKNNSNQEKRNFTIFLKKDSLEFLKDLVFYKATVERQIFFNQSEAIIEALKTQEPLFTDMVPRPEEIREQEKMKKGGRKRFSDDIYDATTTIYIPLEYFDFIKDVTFNKVIMGDLYYKDWDLLESGIQSIKEKYGDKVKPRPDYIREEEIYRGRGSKK